MVILVLSLIKDGFKFMATWAIWDIILIVVPAVILIAYIFPRKNIKGVYIDKKLDRINPTYQKVIRVSIKNLSKVTIYLSSAGFNFGHTIKPSPHGAKDTNTKTYEIKFEGRIPGILSESGTLIRPDQQVFTWIPLDNNESENKIRNALENDAIGILKLKSLKLKTGWNNFIRLRVSI